MSLDPLVETRQIGDLRVHAIQAGGQKLDGGAMFGVVPKTLWERRIPADERNRIQLGMRCLLIEHAIGPVLIDTGVGNKENDKFYDIYGIDNAGANGATRLEDGLAQVGLAPKDVAMVISSHLHFDHAGGNTTKQLDGSIAPTFANARYVMQRGEYDWATHTNERTAGSYFPHNYVPIHESGQLEFIEGDREIIAGVHSVKTPGHTPHHQGLLIESAGERAFYIADLSPTVAHLPLPWIMGYDVEPLVTLETKRRILARAVDENWLLIFEHDATTPWSYIANDAKKGYGVRP
ncbi:MAG TPA: MBL fold metallo-hydrolase [Gemmatimonadaceae bacterium]|jgi:glyoxylase-like metal-dependent hydrolase (beta-lactamase superfamily II)